MKRKCFAWPLEMRLEAVRARKRGLSALEVSRLTGMSRSVVDRCLRMHKKYGEAGLGEKWRRRNGDSGRISPKVAAAEQVISRMGPLPEGTGIGKVQGLLYRLGLLKVSRGTVEKVIERQKAAPKPQRKRRRNRPPKIRYFERAKPNDLWQTDIMTFMLKGQYRVYLISFMDDNSRFIVGWGLHRRQTTSNVLEVFQAAIEKCGMPKEVLSDNGRQYYAWRGRSQFTVKLTKLGIRHIRSRPYHPQTLGKVESFWRNMWQECLSHIPLSSFEEAREKIGEYIENYNYKRPHQGIGNLVPADRFFQVAGQVKDVIEENTAKVEQGAVPPGDYKPPTYLIGNIGGKELRVVARDAQVTLKDIGADKVESGAGAEKSPEGGCPDTSQGAEGPFGASAGRLPGRSEAENGAAIENQTSQPSGEAGVDPAGSGEAGSGEGAVPAGGGVEGVVLPVAEEVPERGPEGAGGGVPGAEGGTGGGCPQAGAGVEGADRGIGEGKESPGERMPAPEGSGGGGGEDHQAQCVGGPGEGEGI